MLSPYIFRKEDVRFHSPVIPEGPELLMGFMEGAQEIDYSDKSIEEFAKFAIFAIFKTYGYHHLLPAFLKGDASRRFYKLALMPIRDLYIKLGAITNIDEKEAMKVDMERSDFLLKDYFNKFFSELIPAAS